MVGQINQSPMVRVTLRPLVIIHTSEFIFSISSCWSDGPSATHFSYTKWELNGRIHILSGTFSQQLIRSQMNGIPQGKKPNLSSLQMQL